MGSLIETLTYYFPINSEFFKKVKSIFSGALKGLFITQIILIITFASGFPLEIYLFAGELISFKLVAVALGIGLLINLLLFNLLKYNPGEAVFFVLYLLLVSATVPLLALGYTLPLIALYFAFFLIKNRRKKTIPL